MVYLRNNKKTVVLSVVVLIAGIWFLIGLNSKQDNNLVFEYSNVENRGSFPVVFDTPITDNSELDDWKKTLQEIDFKDSKKYDSGNAEAILDKNKANLTKMVITKIFDGYLRLKLSGETVDSENLGSIAQKATGDARNTVKGKIYSYSDLKAASSNSNTYEIIKAYGNKIGGIIDKNFANVPDKPELAVLEDVIEKYRDEMMNMNEEDFRVITEKRTEELEREMKVYINAYNGSIIDLLQVEVPRDALKMHLALINSFSSLIEANRNMSIAHDPTATMLGMALYVAESRIIFKIIEDLSIYFERNNVVFFEGEDGYIFKSLLASNSN